MARAIYVASEPGKPLILMGYNDNGSGAAIFVFNKTGEVIADMSADEYGMGYVGAYNREGRGRMLEPGP